MNKTITASVAVRELQDLASDIRSQSKHPSLDHNPTNRSDVLEHSATQIMMDTCHAERHLFSNGSVAARQDGAQNSFATEGYDANAHDGNGPVTYGRDSDARHGSTPNVEPVERGSLRWAQQHLGAFGSEESAEHADTSQSSSDAGILAGSVSQSILRLVEKMEKLGIPDIAQRVDELARMPQK